MSITGTPTALATDVCRPGWVVTGDGVRLSVRDRGPRDAPYTVVFLHGLCLSQTAWTAHSGYVARRFGGRVRVISYDHRGHGRSDSAPMHTYRVDQLADDLNHVLDALGVTGAVILVGHSMGAMAALCAATRPRPAGAARISGLVLCASAAGRLTERGLGRLLNIPALGTLVALIDNTPAVASRALAAPLGAALGQLRHHGRASQQALAAVAADALATTALATAVGFLPSLRDYDQYTGLAGITATTVILSGGADVLTPVAHSHDMASAIPGAVHIHLPAVGHMLPQEAPHCVNGAVSRMILAAQGFPPTTPNSKRAAVAAS